MHVMKRNGTLEPVRFDKILTRIQRLSEGLKVDPAKLSQKVISGVYDGIKSIELDHLAAEISAVMVDHYDYTKLAARIAVSSLHKETDKSFYRTAKRLHDAGIMAQDVFDFIKDNRQQLDDAVVSERDYRFDYFGFKTLEYSYLQKVNGAIVERPQHMWMRVATGIHTGNVAETIDLYNLLSEGYYTHATPTLFNSGTKKPQMSSCFLIAMKDDSIEGIFDTLKDCALISKNAGGIGVHVHNIRAKNSYIAGTNGRSNGLVPMLKVFNEVARYVDQGGQKRKGSVAIYLEPWHADILDWLDLKKATGKEEVRTRDLFLGLWTPDLFMQRVKEDGDWTLFCPNQAKGLADVWGQPFNELYSRYEKEGKGRQNLKARDLWVRILTAQAETGVPYLLFKDAANAKSNQQNLGTIKSSNLCVEIIEYSSPEETAVCNLSSICLPMFVDGLTINWQKLEQVAYKVIKNLNKVIDRNYYPIESARLSNMRHRPVGLGVQGLADLFFMVGLPYESSQAKNLNQKIFETIYFGAASASVQLAKEQGPYETFKGSPASEGRLQFDLWNTEPTHTPDLDWPGLKAKLKLYGMRNSLLIALMPTASTGQIMGNQESVEPMHSNIFRRKTLAGEFMVVNKHLVRDLEVLGLWNQGIYEKIVASGGSVQLIEEIPQDLRSKYKTVWEISQRAIIDMAADRAPFICQSQSMNLYMANPNVGKLNSMHFYSWEKGLKTAQYYLRSRPSLEAQKVTTQIEQKPADAVACSIENKEDCVSCSA